MNFIRRIRSLFARKDLKEPHGPSLVLWQEGESPCQAINAASQKIPPTLMLEKIDARLIEDRVWELTAKYRKPPAEIVVAEVEAKSVKITCANLEITDNGRGQGKTIIDGVELHGVRSIEVSIDPKSATVVKINYLPMKDAIEKGK